MVVAYCGLKERLDMVDSVTVGLIGWACGKLGDILANGTCLER
jgi:hypothetical protein